MCFPRALPLSPHPVTCAESDQGEEQRAPGHGGHGQGVLPSVAPQLSRASPHRSFPSSYSERGGSFHANEPPSPNNFLMPPWALGQAPVPECGQWVHWGGVVGAAGWEVTLCPGAGATRHPRGPSAHPPTTLRIGPERPLVSRPRHTSCDLVTTALRAAPGPALCSVPFLPLAGLPFCVPCDLRALYGLPSDPQGESVHGALMDQGQD